VTPATKPWTGGNELNFEAATTDHIYDPTLQDHLFLSMASQPLGAKTGETWATAFLDTPEEGCGTAQKEPITVDGANGLSCGQLVALWVADRGYFIRLYTSDDEPWLATAYDDAWFRTVLDSVKLDPGKAVDASPAA